MSPEFPFLTYIIGHEMCHGFDASGANFNERGELYDWWAIDDRLVFKKKQDQLIGIFNQYYVGGEELLEMKRRFFKSYAVFYAQYSSLDEKIKQVEQDVHTINEYRINGIVNNLDDWYRLYDVTEERKFYLSPERRVHLW